MTHKVCVIYDVLEERRRYVLLPQLSEIERNRNRNQSHSLIELLLIIRKTTYLDATNYHEDEHSEILPDVKLYMLYYCIDVIQCLKSYTKSCSLYMLTLYPIVTGLDVSNSKLLLKTLGKMENLLT